MLLRILFLKVRITFKMIKIITVISTPLFNFGRLATLDPATALSNHGPTVMNQSQHSKLIALMGFDFSNCDEPITAQQTNSSNGL